MRLKIDAITLDKDDPAHNNVNVADLVYQIFTEDSKKTNTHKGNLVASPDPNAQKSMIDLGIPLDFHNPTKCVRIIVKNTAQLTGGLPGKKITDDEEHRIGTISIPIS